MSKALENLMEDRIAARANERFAEGRAEGRAEGIAIGEERGILLGEERGRAEGIRSILEKLTLSGKLTEQEASVLMASL